MLADLIEIPQHFLAMQRGVIEQRFERQLLIIDDVPQPPRAAQPGLRIVPALLARLVAERVFVDLVRRYCDRRRQPRAGGFRQNPQPAVKRLVCRDGLQKS